MQSVYTAFNAVRIMPSSGIITTVQKGGTLYNCISGLTSQLYKLKKKEKKKIYVWCKIHGMPEMYNLKFVKC